MHSPDLTQRNIDAIAELFPTVVTETVDAEGNPVRAVDFDALRQELSDHVVEGPQERYQLDWPGKRAAAFAANAPIAKTLRPVREESVDFDTTKNLFIEGDNLDALKLLQESYLGKVKLIYIDPPYNTGKDFIYNDDFAESTANYLARSAQATVEGERLVANPESNGRFHSDWLSMMFPRLKLSRSLLREDGVICVSVDDHELANLRLLLAELFGPDNFIGVLPRVTKRAGKSSDLIAFNHDYVVIFGRSSSVALNRQFHTDSGFSNVDEYAAERGKYKLNQTLDYGSIAYSRSLDYEIEVDGQTIRPGGVTREEMQARQQRNPRSGWCWRWSRELYEFGRAQGFVVVKDGRDGRRIYTKTYENASIKRRGGSYEVVIEPRTKAVTSLELIDNRFSNDSATKNIKSLFDFSAFDYTKPVELVARLVELVTASSDGDIVLDFFAGSGTTGHAVMKVNAADLGNRRYVLVQLGESTASDSEAARNGYQMIPDLARERLRRGARSLASQAKAGQERDFGFRAMRIDSTCFADVLRPPDATTQSMLAAFTDHVKPDRSDEDLLIEALLAWGLDPSLSIRSEAVHGKRILTAGDDAVIAYFDDAPDGAVIAAVAAREPLRAVFLDSSFSSDAARINLEQIFAQKAPNTEIRTI